MILLAMKYKMKWGIVLMKFSSPQRKNKQETPAVNIKPPKKPKRKTDGLIKMVSTIHNQKRGRKA